MGYSSPPDGSRSQTPVQRFDYITRLVSHHEQQITQQSIQLSELNRKAHELEKKQAASLPLLEGLKDRAVLEELNGLQSRVDELSSGAQQLQDKLQEEPGGPRGLQAGVMQAELTRLQQQVSHIKRAQQELQSRMRTLVHQEIDQMKSLMMEQLKQEIRGLAVELRAELNAVRAESAAAASSVEAASLTASSSAMKLRQHVQASNTALSQVVARLDATDAATQGVSSDVGQLETDMKKVKRHVIKLERTVEGLQALGSVALNADKAMAAMRQDAHAIQAVSEGVAGRLDKAERHIENLAAVTARNRHELSQMAESIGTALRQVSEAAQRAACSHPTPYLSSLLGPIPSLPGLARLQVQNYQPSSNLSPLGTSPAPPLQQSTATSSYPAPGATEFDTFLASFRSRRQAETLPQELNCSLITDNLI